MSVCVYVFVCVHEGGCGGWTKREIPTYIETHRHKHVDRYTDRERKKRERERQKERERERRLPEHSAVKISFMKNFRTWW